jgi:hypothetical protein
MVIAGINQQNLYCHNVRVEVYEPDEILGKVECASQNMEALWGRNYNNSRRHRHFVPCRWISSIKAVFGSSHCEQTFDVVVTENFSSLRTIRAVVGLW